MTSARSGVGPDIAIVGSARSGTSFLAAQLSSHAGIDPPAVKEPNFFSRHLDRGSDWYDSLFPRRREESFRLDASMSYTFPHFPEAMGALAAAAPHAQIVYVVRDPLPRALSHYLLHRHYFQNEPGSTFGEGIAGNPVYLGASDYAHWLGVLVDHFPPEQLLVVPFETVTGTAGEVAEVITDRVGLPPPDPESAAAAVKHRNDVVAIRSNSVLMARRWLKETAVYPWLRRAVGPDRLRRLRAHLTSDAPEVSLEDALQTCSHEQRGQIEDLRIRSIAAVSDYLTAQDSRTHLGWAESWLSVRDV